MIINYFSLYRIKQIRDDKFEAPDNFLNEMNKWSLESIARIALETRLGILTNIEKNSDAQKFIEVRLSCEISTDC